MLKPFVNDLRPRIIHFPPVWVKLDFLTGHDLRRYDALENRPKSLLAWRLHREFLRR